MKLGRYNLLHRIGAGGMAEVWKARVEGPSRFQKTIAIKRLLPAFSQRPDVVRGFIEEARLVAEMSHPNIVQVFDFGKEDDDYFIAMEFVNGVDLSALQRARQLPLEASVFVVLETCKALGFAHARAVIHRDVSPRNILISLDGEVKVTDFGIAKVTTMISETLPGILKGKPPFMSPEQVRHRPIDQRSDLFSLGCVLWELSVGSRLFTGMPVEVINQILAYTAPPREPMESLPMAVRDVLTTLLQADPDERYPSAVELEAALMDIVQGRGLVEARTALAAFVKDVAGAPHTPAVVAPPVDPSGSTNPTLKADTEPVPDPESEPGSWHTATAPVQSTNRGHKAAARPAPRRDPPIAWAGLIAVVALLLAAGLTIRFWPSPGAEPIAEAGVSPSPSRSPSPERPSPTPSVFVAKRTRTKVPATPIPSGTLRIHADPWVQVWVNDRLLAAETPWMGELPAGTHTVVFINPNKQFRKRGTVKIYKGRETSVFVDTGTGTIEIE